MSEALQPHGLEPARFLCSWDSQVRIQEWVAFSFSRDLPQPGIEPVSSAPLALAGRFFTTELPGKPTTVLVSPKNKTKLRVVPKFAFRNQAISIPGVGKDD